jgi:hypothetical protein
VNFSPAPTSARASRFAPPVDPTIVVVAATVDVVTTVVEAGFVELVVTAEVELVVLAATVGVVTGDVATVTVASDEPQVETKHAPARVARTPRFRQPFIAALLPRKGSDLA